MFVNIISKEDNAPFYAITGASMIAISRDMITIHHTKNGKPKITKFPQELFKVEYSEEK